MSNEQMLSFEDIETLPSLSEEISEKEYIEAIEREIENEN